MILIMWGIKTRWYLIYFLILSITIHLLLLLAVKQKNFYALKLSKFHSDKNVGMMTSSAHSDVIPCIGDRKSNLRELILNQTVYKSRQTWRAIKRQCNHLMTTAENIGRTGNQLFQVAALLGTALKHGYLPVVPLTISLAQWFDLPFLADEIPSNAKIFRDHHCAIYNNSLVSLDHQYNWTLRGYYQSWRYFSHVQDVVRSAFRIKKRYLDEARSFLSNVTIKGVPNIGIHIRRGDMLLGGDLGFNVADVGFIKRAMDFYRTRFDRVQFVIVSDGMLWCMENIKGHDILYSPFYRPITDLALLTLSDHVIVTSGTFGWWGAWMANGTTVYFRGYPQKGSKLYDMTNMTDYYPPSWIGL